MDKPGYISVPLEPEMPAAEITFLRQAYDQAQVILEYGSGGSTVVAASQPNKLIFAVESDPKFLCRLNTYLMQLRSGSRAIPYHVDIGPVGKWGRPSDTSAWKQYPDYARAIWEQDFFVQPDTVLIDGRFRVACFLVCATLTRRPPTLLFDDYAPRPRYHVVERLARPVKQVGRMAVFHLRPGEVDPRELLSLSPSLYDPA